MNWRYRESAIGGPVDAGYHVYGAHVVADVLGSLDDPEVLRNAKLIAAAPQMHEAIMAWFNSNSPKSGPDADRANGLLWDVAAKMAAEMQESTNA